MYVICSLARMTGRYQEYGNTLSSKNRLPLHSTFYFLNKVWNRNLTDKQICVDGKLTIREYGLGQEEEYIPT